MKRTKLLVVVTALCGIAASSQGQLPERAPDVLPGTLPEMREPSYWIERMDDPDGVILTTREILDWNRRYREKVSEPDFFASIPEYRRSKLNHYFPGIALVERELHGLPERALADTVRRYIDIEIEYLRGREWGNSNDVKYAGWEIDELVEEMARDSVGGRAELRDAIAVRNTRLKNVPAFFPEKLGLVKSGARARWDNWSIGVLQIARPVRVLHSSRSGEFAFIQCDIGYGWVRAEDIAFAGRDEMRRFVDPARFVVCTGDRIQVYSDESCTWSSGWIRMGDRLPLAVGSDRRSVLVPVRETDGSLAAGVAWLAEDADVSVGYLPYTRRNIVGTAFKLLDNAYDFTATFFGRQHETTYRDIFSVFGFELPWHGGMFSHYGDSEFVLDNEIGTESQYEKILEFEPFVTVMITLQDTGGHAQLLLGERDGVPIVFDQHGYSYEDGNGVELIVRRCVVDDITMPAYFLKRRLTFLELK